MSLLSETTDRDRAVVSPSQWIARRKAFLAKEKEYTHLRDSLAEQRRALPRVLMEKDYAFESASGTHSLADLFGNKSQLAIYHFMFGPDWAEGCPSCSLIADHLNAGALHIRQRDVSLVLVSRAPVQKLEAFKRRMGWNLPWFSSLSSDFNRDFGVHFEKDQVNTAKRYNFETTSFPAEEAPGMSMFERDEAGHLFHTYSTYGRGLEEMLGIYAVLDMTPKGRDESEMRPHAMAWVRHHDRYPDAALHDISIKGSKSECGCS